MNILVTGGAGFVGSHLCERLVKDNTVYSIDDYSSGSKENHVSGVYYLKMSTKDIEKLSFVPDMIYHLGEYSRVENSFENIHSVIESNIQGTAAVFEFARKHNIRIIYAGSSTKFGDIGSDSSPYAWTKAHNTELLNKLGEWYDLDYAITYFYNVYSQREIATGPYATVIAKFLHKMRNGEKIVVTSPGTQVRNFTHVDDIVDGLILVGEKGQGDGYGIGNDESYSILDVVNILGIDYVFGPERKGNRMVAPVLSEKTKYLGWKAKKSLKDYLIEEKMKIINEPIHSI